jgi:hypothetical protein
VESGEWKIERDRGENANGKKDFKKLEVFQ